MEHKWQNKIHVYTPSLFWPLLECSRIVKLRPPKLVHMPTSLLSLLTIGFGAIILELMHQIPSELRGWMILIKVYV